MKKIEKSYLPKFREGALSMPEFNRLTKEQRNEYISQLFEVPVSERGDVDNHILKFYTLPVKEVQFFSIEE